ncbi:MAG: hypothetical protein IKL41_00940 [Clostridia bacterium]|nr:hypothetical protein [Clostridia bacterium]
MANEKTKAFFQDIKDHWHEPDRSKGNFVPYKEYLHIFLGIMFNYAARSPLGYIGFGASCYLIMYHYNLPYLAFSVVGLIGLPLGYIWNIVGWIVSDNLGFMPKKTARSVNTFYMGSFLIGLLLLVFDASKLLPADGALVSMLDSFAGISARSVFKIFGIQILFGGLGGLRDIFWRKKLVPKYGRYKYILYSNFFQKSIAIILIGWLPVYNIQDVDERFWIAYLLFSLFNLYSFDDKMETCAFLCSPNVQERIKIRTYPVKIAHLLNSIVAMVIPLLGEFSDINFYRYVLPGFFIPIAALTLVFAGKVQERIPQPPLEKKQDVSFWYGIFEVMRNKYNWINTTATLIDALGNGMIDIMAVIYLYSMRLSGLEYSLLTLLFTFRGTIPNFIAPYIMKKFSYRTLKLFKQALFTVSIAMIIGVLAIAGENVSFCAITLYIILWIRGFLEEIVKMAESDMSRRMGDYQMYLSGERLENFGGVFSWFIAPVTTVVGLVIPIMLLSSGFNSNWDVFFIDAARFRLLAIPLAIDLVGHILMMIPFGFWNYNNRQHDYVMKVLVQRAELAQEGYIPAEYKGGLTFTESGKLDGEIPVDIESVVAAADIGSAEELAAIKMN